LRHVSISDVSPQNFGGTWTFARCRDYKYRALAAHTTSSTAGTVFRSNTDARTIIPRNFGTGPGSFTVNLRLSKTFGFGNELSGVSSSQSGRSNEGGGGPRRSILTGGGIGGGRGGGGRSRGADGGDADTGKRYNMTFSLNFQNLLNHTNAGAPIGNLSSQLFGISTSSAGNFGGFGGLNSNAYNRRIEAQIRFNF
jgi:hypothetical protein